MAPAPSAHELAVRIASWGPRPAASNAEARAQRLAARGFERAGLRVGIQEFRVPGRGSSRNVIGVHDTDASCLRIVMAHSDTTPNAPGANDNASGVAVVTELAGRLDRIEPACDVWLVATGAEERIYTGSPWHTGFERAAADAGSSGRCRWTRSGATGPSGCARRPPPRAEPSRGTCSPPRGTPACR